jgi:hypothetical protein
MPDAELSLLLPPWHRRFCKVTLNVLCQGINSARSRTAWLRRGTWQTFIIEGGPPLLVLPNFTHCLHSAMQTRKSLIPHRRDVNRTLRFTEDGTFQISVFSDLHFAEGT